MYMNAYICRERYSDQYNDIKPCVYYVCVPKERREGDWISDFIPSLHPQIMTFQLVKCYQILQTKDMSLRTPGALQVWPSYWNRICILFICAYMYMYIHTYIYHRYIYTYNLSSLLISSTLLYPSSRP